MPEHSTSMYVSLVALNVLNIMQPLINTPKFLAIRKIPQCCMSLIGSRLGLKAPKTKKRRPQNIANNNIGGVGNGA